MIERCLGERSIDHRPVAFDEFATLSVVHDADHGQQLADRRAVAEKHLSTDGLLGRPKPRRRGSVHHRHEWPASVVRRTERPTDQQARTECPEVRRIDGLHGRCHRRGIRRRRVGWPNHTRMNSRLLGIAAGEYMHVEQVDASHNRLTVARDTGEQLTYDPRRLQGVTVYRESERSLAVGDRVQVTAPDQARHLANRELGTVERMDPTDATHALHVRLDSGRAVAFERDRSLNLDYGYAVTSHSSQGQTADRVLAHIDTERAGEALVNRRFAYVALSRSRYDAQVYTNDRAELTQALGREHGHRSALELSVGQKSETPELAKSTKMTQTIGHGFSH